MGRWSAISPCKPCTKENNKCRRNSREFNIENGPGPAVDGLHCVFHPPPLHRADLLQQPWPSPHHPSPYWDNLGPELGDCWRQVCQSLRSMIVLLARNMCNVIFSLKYLHCVQINSFNAFKVSKLEIHVNEK